VEGFFRSISLEKGHVQQDVLRLLTLWFRYGSRPDVEAALVQGLDALSIGTWLEVIPQIIARINSPDRRVRKLIHHLLLRVGQAHPQALIYPLTVAAKSHSQARRSAAESIMQQMEQFAPRLVQQAKLVSDELIRCAILWYEMWHEALEEASRLYFAERNVPGMLEVLRPMHQLMQRGAETKREIQFQQQLGRDLQDAYDWCNKYRQSGQEKDLQQAWELYYTVFRNISKQLPRMTNLELEYVSPALAAARDLCLSIPGQYRPGRPVVGIQSVENTMTVIMSKQRPRKCTMVGSDGRKYTYLLKGHEDLRQDERVMQLFGLVNTLLVNDRECSQRDLQIVRYAVMPLSPNSGLIEWVPDCDTLHALVRDYRDSRKILLNIEQRLMLAMAPDYDNLQLMGKVEVFQHALANTTGQDLNKVLWLKSNNAEDWLDRRTNYTRSLALMSMVGYIMGLGDRHPSNLMLHKYSGKIVHIDFGDCFEVAMHRDKFPEKIPFRLTRMLTSAMEVSGVEGTFRFTCENVMRVMRANKGSVMAMLEAFVHDPLINWRLLGAEKTNNPSASNGDTTAGAGSPPGPAAGQQRHAPANGASERSLESSQMEASDENDESSQDNHHRDNSSEGSSGDEAADFGGPAPAEMPAASLRPRYGSVAANMSHSRVEDEQGAMAEVLNDRAVKVIARVQQKMTGRDFENDKVLGVEQQVDKLIKQARSNENLCQAYIGWCPFW